MFRYLFSIVMAVYNAEKYIEEAIDSVIDQDLNFLDNVQLILVDDGSTDSSGVICDRYGKRFPSNITVIHKENGGVSSARNKGLQFISGKYVNFLDSDDKFSKDVLRKVKAFFEKNYDLTDLVSVPIVFFDGKEGPHQLNYKYENGSRVIDLKKEYNCIQLSISSAFIKSGCLKQIRFDTRLENGEDAKVCQEVLLDKMTLGAVSGCCYWYRRHSAGELSAIQKSQLTTEWYIPFLKLFSCEVLQLAEKKRGFIPLFIQFVIMYDLQWPFKVALKNENNVLSEAERKEFFALLYGLLLRIDDEVILRQRQISVTHKSFLLGKKHHVIPCIPDNLIIKIAGHRLLFNAYSSKEKRFKQACGLRVVTEYFKLREWLYGIGDIS